MKRRIASISRLGGFLLLASTAEMAIAAEPARLLTPTALTLSCADAATTLRSAKDAARELQDFYLDPASSKIKEDHGITVLRLKPGLRSDLKVVGIIERGPEGDAEIPRITAICINGTVTLASTGKKADIEFKSTTGDKIPVRLHLNNKKGDPGFLKYTTWKTTGPASIWIVGPFAPGTAHDPPSPKTWPACLGTATTNGPDISFAFDKCANHPGGSTQEYEYAIHMSQANGDATVDIGIDPLIINHPP